MLPTITRTLINPMEDLQREVDRLFDHACSGWTNRSATAAYPVDIREDDEQIIVEAELPGFQKNQIEVTFDQEVLNLNASRDAGEEQGQSHLHERCYTRFARSFRLPNTVDPSRVTATLTNGVLTLILPKRQETKPRKIQIN